MISVSAVAASAARFGRSRQRHGRHIVVAAQRVQRDRLDLGGVHHDVADVARELESRALGGRREDLVPGGTVEQHRVGARSSDQGVAPVARVPDERVVSGPAELGLVARARDVSFPSPPSMTSTPANPAIASLPAPPLMVRCRLPVRVSLPMPQARRSHRGIRLPRRSRGRRRAQRRLIEARSATPVRS